MVENTESESLAIEKAGCALAGQDYTLLGVIHVDFETDEVQHLQLKIENGALCFEQKPAPQRVGETVA